MHLRSVLLFSLATSMALPAFAVPVDVTLNGRVESNMIRDGRLATVMAGDTTTLTFRLESDLFVDGTTFPTRGYEIDTTSFSWTLGSVDVGAEDPFPTGMTPYFVLRNDDPAVDGFFLSVGLDWPSSIPLDEPGRLGPFGARFNVTYTGDTLPSLDILDTVGFYEYAGLTVYGHAVTDSSFDAMLIEFVDLTIDSPGSVETLLYRASVDDVDPGWKLALPLPLEPGPGIDLDWPVPFPVPGAVGDSTGWVTTAPLLVYRALEETGAALANQLRLVKNTSGSVITISY